MMASIRYELTCVEEDAEQQRGRVPDGEQADIEADVLQPVEEEDDAEQEQQVVVAGDHVLGAKIEERRMSGPDFLDKALVAERHGVGVGVSTECQKEGKTKQRQKTWSVPRMKRPRPALSRRSIHG